MTEEVEELERALSRLLQRVDPPGTLVGSVMDRVAVEPRRVLAFPRRARIVRLTGSLAASLLLASLLFGGVEHRRAASRAKAEQDFARSLEITDRALAQTRQQLQRAGIALDE